jgi:hypothetical protein
MGFGAHDGAAGCNAAQWEAAFAAGATPGALLLDLAQRPEALASRADGLLVNTLYLAMLDRGPDPQGFAWWEQTLAESADARPAITGFLASEEYQARFLGEPASLEGALGLLGQPAPEALGSEALLGG